MLALRGEFVFKFGICGFRKFWRFDSGNSGRLILCLRRSRVVKSEVLGPHRRSVEREYPTTLKNPIQDGVCEIFIVQHTAPSWERLVRCEDHRALFPVTIVDDVEEHVGGVRAVREVADLVADEDAGMNVGSQGIGEPPAAKGC